MLGRSLLSVAMVMITTGNELDWDGGEDQKTLRYHVLEITLRMEDVIRTRFAVFIYIRMKRGFFVP